MNKKIKNLMLTPFNWLYRISPKTDIKLLYRLKCHKKLDLDHPRTYNEKLNWLKLFYRNELMPVCADKFKARGYVESMGYGKYLPQLYWHGDKAEDIPFDTLPDAFVLKSTSGSGNNIIVHDKSKLDIEATKKQVSMWLKEKYLIGYGEWHYEKIKPSIIVEELLSDGVNFVPADFKFFCFNNYNGSRGSVGCIAVDLDRYVGHKRLIFDDEWTYLPDVDFGFDNKYDSEIPKPAKFDEMCEVATKLASPFPHCRVDFFVLGDNFYIGELTFFNGAGFDMVSPAEYNELMGSWIKLPDNKD